MAATLSASGRLPDHQLMIALKGGRIDRPGLPIFDPEDPVIGGPEVEANEAGGRPGWSRPEGYDPLPSLRRGEERGKLIIKNKQGLLV